MLLPIDLIVCMTNVLKAVSRLDPLDSRYEVDVGTEDEKDGVHHEVVHARDRSEVFFELRDDSVMIDLNLVVSINEAGDALLLPIWIGLGNSDPVRVIKTDL